ncbi:hypothetical protein GS387_003681 [Salmonella enterica subsp. enterica serovar Hadar]|uniref:Uncharacterized protein n=1 Tax=Salmonella enterica TaxID=28901 RepID=A0A625SZI0_SALER|nr:hypothetical protein [Klebsiella pneumoniae]ECY6724971.1 hypothetical protein [Salmonella enterica subsp. enterica serovar Hadar]EDZ7016795.1 hypothetical protein [Salmonella enterica]EJY0793134.1 hypothetical protein [Salmonella enterica subsp. enterica serovar Infantis]ECY9003750.1 hypothetical protein [Salmonella enterica subsp. enterica serovar Hadar]ECZ1185014.1 hypothetical protein [Salmonella enterica subsp. enterica serovar Hadar]
MNKLSDKSSNPVFTVIAIMIFFFFLPAIGAVLGTTGEIYIDGLRELPSFGMKAIIVSIWMLVVAYLMCRLMKAEKDFIRIPAILTLIGAVLLPLTNSFQNVMAMPDPDVSTRTDFYAKSIEGLETIKNGIMFIAPALLCAISSIILAVGMISILRKRYHL